MYSGERIRSLGVGGDEATAAAGSGSFDSMAGVYRPPPGRQTRIRAAVVRVLNFVLVRWVIQQDGNYTFQGIISSILQCGASTQS